ncbi:MAG: hypothetical protein ACR2RB_10260, partial [Gammaproteobacteria bacterium]
ECGHPDWDGYGATPITPEAIRQAMAFALALPGHIPTPDVLPEADGEVEFEWYADNEHIVSVSVNANGVLSYVARFGLEGRARGTEVFAKRIPSPILSAIQRAMSK